MTKKQHRKRKYLFNKMAKKIVQTQPVDEIVKMVLKEKDGN